MNVYGYARISTKEQKADRQLDAFLERRIPSDNVFVDKASGRDFSRPGYQKLLQRVGEGDLIVVKSIDRLGRNYSEIIEQWRAISKERGIFIEVLDMPLLNTAAGPDGLTGVFISDIVLQILAYVAENERIAIHKRQEEGIAAAKARGTQFGRKRIELTEEFEEAFNKWKSGELSTLSLHLR